MDTDIRTWETIFDQAASRSIRRIRSHSFLRRCRDGGVTLRELNVFLVQQAHYSSDFTRYLCALMSNLPTNADILALGANLFEELGLENRESVPHSIMYKNMMTALGVSMADAAPLPQTQALSSAMLAACRDANSAVGLGALCLGAEALVPAVYADLIAGFGSCGIHAKDLEFFRVHVDCDDHHAETIRDIMVRLATTDERLAVDMVDSGRALVEARWHFFSAIEDYARDTPSAHREPTPTTAGSTGSAPLGQVL